MCCMSMSMSMGCVHRNHAISMYSDYCLQQQPQQQQHQQQQENSKYIHKSSSKIKMAKKFTRRKIKTTVCFSFASILIRISSRDCLLWSQLVLFVYLHANSLSRPKRLTPSDECVNYLIWANAISFNCCIRYTSFECVCVCRLLCLATKSNHKFIERNKSVRIV